MRISHGVAIAASCWHIASAQQNEQQVLANPFVEDDPQPVNIAIIGAGAAGSSSAYHLAHFAALAGISINITLFERNSYIGGRSTTVYAYDDPLFPVELGASIFVKVNSILNSAVDEFNLSTAEFIPSEKIPGPELAVWNGEEIVLTQNSGGWWDIARLLWKYGLAPVKTMRLKDAVVGKFLAMYEAPHFPFKSLTQTAQDVGLLAVTAATGEQYMTENGIGGDFGRDVVQASTRVNYAQNLEHIHGLEAMVCMAAENAMSVAGGNWQIFDRMAKASHATVLLGADVTRLETNEDESWELDFTRRSEVDLEESVAHHQTFDSVILAAPHRFANISRVTSTEPYIPDTIPYVQLHVTLFTSPHLLSSTFFNLPSTQPAPRVILTTLPKTESARRGPESAGSPGFFSISLLHTVRNPQTNNLEYLYKIFSPTPPNSTFLSNLLGIPSPSSNDEISGEDVTWMFRKVWHSYPYEYPRVTFEESELERNLWYTSGIESFISTMETSALMGKNVARLIVDRLLERKTNDGTGWEETTVVK